jgi:hypothetical protein
MTGFRGKPRSGVYELYWQFAAERQAIFERRIAGSPQPWSSDPIFERNKFCNVFRAADRVSQFLIGSVIYGDCTTSDADLLFQIVAFRLFSNIDTWCGVLAHLGHAPTITDLMNGAFVAALDATKAENGGLYTGAFILCATDAFGYREKHRNHVALLQRMFAQSELPRTIANARDLGQVFATLRTYPLIGDFMAYQLAIDINYSELIDFSENSFVKPGPGAVRGIRKVFEDVNPRGMDDAIMWMVEHQKLEFDRLGLKFNGLFGRPLHAIDCQGLFCEVDKYCREAVPELKSPRSRIKQRFTPSPNSIELFFPPKWGINQRIEALREAS